MLTIGDFNSFWFFWDTLYIVECFRFSVCVKYEAGNLVKDKGFLCLLIIPCIFDEGRLVDKEIFCFVLNLPKKFCRQNERLHDEENTGFKFHMRTIENEAIMIYYLIVDLHLRTYRLIIASLIYY